MTDIDRLRRNVMSTQEAAAAADEIDRLREAIISADSICSLIYYRERHALSPQSAEDLKLVVDELAKLR